MQDNGNKTAIASLTQLQSVSPSVRQSLERKVKLREAMAQDQGGGSHELAAEEEEHKGL